MAADWGTGSEANLIESQPAQICLEPTIVIDHFAVERDPPAARRKQFHDGIDACLCQSELEKLGHVQRTCDLYRMGLDPVLGGRKHIQQISRPISKERRVPTLSRYMT